MKILLGENNFLMPTTSKSDINLLKIPPENQVFQEKNHFYEEKLNSKNHFHSGKNKNNDEKIHFSQEDNILKNTDSIMLIRENRLDNYSEMEYFQAKMNKSHSNLFVKSTKSNLVKRKSTFWCSIYEKRRSLDLANIKREFEFNLKRHGKVSQSLIICNRKIQNDGWK